mmetsp:Transcript_4863/g.11382  ORF Transcript_4863/g.11382 Transcript_4863/m.11382 type:complete len:365 (+) Transcript_4863:209-1303(+)
MLLYTAWASYQYHIRPEVETFSMTPTLRLKPFTVSVRTWCTAANGCVLRNETTGEIKRYTEFRERYKDLSEEEKNHCSFNPPESTAFALTQPLANRTFKDVQLCFTQKDTNGIDIWIPGFVIPDSVGQVCEYGNNCSKMFVAVTAGEMSVRMEMDISQRKTLFLGVNVLEQEGKDSKVELYNGDMFYDGKNSDTSALLRIRVQQFASVFTHERPGTPLDILADVGGFSGLVLPVLAILKVLIDFIQHKLKKDDEDDEIDIEALKKDVEELKKLLNVQSREREMTQVPPASPAIAPIVPAGLSLVPPGYGNGNNSGGYGNGNNSDGYGSGQNAGQQYVTAFVDNSQGQYPNAIGYVPAALPPMHR